MKTIFSQSKAKSLLIISAGLLYISLLPGFDIGCYNDDASYVIAAESLLKGRYDNLYWPGHPSTDFPFPGLPLLLAPFLKIVQPHWHILEWLSVLITLLTMGCYWKLLRSWFSPGIAFCAVAVFAFNPNTAHFSGIVLSEPYFTFAILLSFLMLDRVVTKGTRQFSWVTGVFLGWASLIRPEGIVLPMCIVLSLLCYKKWTDAIRIGCPSFVLYGLFLVRSNIISNRLFPEYHYDLASLLTYWPRHLTELIVSLTRMMDQMMIQNVLGLVDVGAPHSLLACALIFGVTLAALSLSIAGLRHLWADPTINKEVITAGALFCSAYFFIHVFWSALCVRYFIPLLPLLIAFQIRGIQTLRVSPILRRSGLIIVGVCLTLIYSYGNAYAVYESFWSIPIENLAPEHTLNWLRDHTREDGVVLSTIAPSVYLYTQRHSIDLLLPSDEEEFKYMVMKYNIGWILDRRTISVSVVGPQGIDPNRAWVRMRRWIALNPETFHPMRSDAHENTEIFAVENNADYVHAYEWYLSAKADFDAGKMDSGLIKIKKSLTLYPSLAVANNAYGVTCYLQKKNLSLAERLLLNAIQSRPSYPLAMVNLARLYQWEKRRGLSRAFLQRAIDASLATGECESIVKMLQSDEFSSACTLPAS